MQVNVGRAILPQLFERRTEVGSLDVLDTRIITVL